MSTVGKKYQALIERFPLRPLKSEEDLDKAHVLSIELHQKGDALSEDESDYLDMLTDAIQRYEDKHHRIETDEVEPHEILQELMEQHSLSQSDLKVLLGVPQGRASELMNGKRELTKEQLTLLAMRFNVPPSVFLPRERARKIIKFEPEGRFVKITDAITQAIDKAKETGNTYLFDCNGLMMSINKSSKLNELMSSYEKYLDSKPDETVTATISLFE